MDRLLGLPPAPALCTSAACFINGAGRAGAVARARPASAAAYINPASFDQPDAFRQQPVGAFQKHRLVHRKAQRRQPRRLGLGVWEAVQHPAGCLAVGR